MDDLDDLFAKMAPPAPQPAPRAAKPADPLVQAAKRALPVKDAAETYDASSHRGAGRAGAGAAPPGHVYRRHRREGAASPLRRGDRQFHGRGGGRPRDLHRGRARRGRLSDGHRQRPRHAGRSASEVQGQVGARSHHDHAACRRQVRFQGLRDLRRPARRRRLRRQRAVGRSRGRGRARPAALPPALLARRAAGPAGDARRGAQPARHQGPLPSRPADLRQGAAVRAGAALPHGALEGLSVRRRRDPLVLRAGTDRRQGQDAGQGRLPLPRRPEGLSGRLARRRVPGDARGLLPARATSRAGTARSNGR